jgi:hypothetical protein
MSASLIGRSMMIAASMMMAATVTLRIRRRRDNSKSERRGDRKNERKVLQHFLFFLRLRNRVVLSQKVRERSLNEMRKASQKKCERSIGGRCLAVDRFEGGSGVTNQHGYATPTAFYDRCMACKASSPGYTTAYVSRTEANLGHALEFWLARV